VNDIPIIETKRLTLRPVRLSDTDDIFCYASNPNVFRYTTADTLLTLDDAREFVERLVNKPRGAFTLAICLKVDPKVIGVIEFGTRDEKGGVDYSLAEEYWNQGIMTEAVQAMIDWGFSAYPELRTISSSAMTVNRGSSRVMEKCGMKYEKRVREKYEKLEAPVDVDVYIIDRKIWSKRQK
jgi:ribosomal-protein-alanine N-acetyltransferase